MNNKKSCDKVERLILGECYTIKFKSYIIHIFSASLSSRTGNVIKLRNFLGVPLWLGDLVARKNGHEDTRTQGFHKEKMC